VSEGSSPPNRRSSERHLACFPAEVARSDGKARPSVIRDLSSSGALVLVATTKLVIGDAVTLQLYVSDDATTFRSAKGTVVRVEDLPGDQAGLWQRRIGVRFDEPLAMTDGEIAGVQERAAKFF
jgi:hypothetical protein